MLQKVYESALPRLQGKKVRDVCIGIELLAVQLDGGEIGVAYVLKNEISCGCASLPEGGFEGMDAQEAASLMLKEKNPLNAALGIAVCNAAADYDALSSKVADASDAFAARPDDVVGMVGNIRPVAKQLEPKVKRLIIFDRADSQGVYPEEQQEELLPQCDLVIITSSSLLNDTFSRVISYCHQAREIVLTGATTPLYPEAFAGTGVTVLAGTRWFPQYKEEIFNGISQGGCLRQIMQYGEKLTVRL
ncbi:MAG: DUF364 domain-containing protein [Syntrophaceticus sp.]